MQVCLDKPKFGGPGKKKKACVHKACLKLDGNLLAPTNAKKTSQTNTCCISKDNNLGN